MTVPHDLHPLPDPAPECTCSAPELYVRTDCGDVDVLPAETPGGLAVLYVVAHCRVCGRVYRGPFRTPGDGAL